MRLSRFLSKCMLVVLAVVTVVGGTLVSAVNFSVAIQCVGGIGYEAVNPEDTDDFGDNSPNTFDYALENIDGHAIEEPDIVEEKTNHWRLRP